MSNPLATPQPHSVLPKPKYRVNRLKLAALGIALLALTLFVVNTTATYAVTFDGSTVAWVKTSREVRTIIAQLTAEAQAIYGDEVWVSGEVRFRRDRLPADTPIDTGEVLRQKLADVLPLLTKGAYILVGGRNVVALASAAEAEQILSDIMEHYKQLASSNGSILTSARFEESYKILESGVRVSLIKTPEQARNILEQGYEVIQERTVQRGETLWSIAAANGLTVSDLSAANPEIKPNLIRPGQTIKLVKPQPYLTVVTTEERTYTEAIGFSTGTVEDPTKWPWERVIQTYGQNGLREKTVSIARRNGREVSRTVLSSRTLRQPVTQVVLVGTKQIPDRGTGQFIWPVVGTITSGFGWRRSGFHYGIDIAAPTGTPIKAADSGTVVEAGWTALGWTVKIDHGRGHLVTVYGHCSKLLVKVGDIVTKQQEIALVGNSYDVRLGGRSTGSHLHFEVRVDGTAVDPITYYPK